MDPLTDRLDLPDSSLLRMNLAPQAQDVDVLDPAETEPPIAEQVSHRKVNVLPRHLTLALGQLQLPCLRWSPSAGQFGGLVKLGSGFR